MAIFVLVHGAFCGAWRWDKVIPLLEKAGHTVVAPDLPGHGNNLKIPREQLNLQSYVDRVTEVLDGQLEPVALVGHSMAGVVISQAAEYRPDKIKKLVYVCAFLLKDGESLRSRGGGHLSPLTASFEDFKRTLYEDCSDEDVRQAKERLVHEPGTIAATPIHITAANYGRIPRVYIECLKDNAISPAVQKQMYTDTPCEGVISMKTSHSPMVAAPEELARHLLSVV